MTPSEAIEQHLRACRDLTAAYLAQLKREDPVAHTGVLGAAAGGAAFRITTSASAQGLCEVGISMVDIHGEVAELAHIDGLKAPRAN